LASLSNRWLGCRFTSRTSLVVKRLKGFDQILLQPGSLKEFVFINCDRRYEHRRMFPRVPQLATATSVRRVPKIAADSGIEVPSFPHVEQSHFSSEHEVDAWIVSIRPWFRPFKLGTGTSGFIGKQRVKLADHQLPKRRMAKRVVIAGHRGYYAIVNARWLGHFLQSNVEVCGAASAAADNSRRLPPRPATPPS